MEKKWLLYLRILFVLFWISTNFLGSNSTYVLAIGAVIYFSVDAFILLKKESASLFSPFVILDIIIIILSVVVILTKRPVLNLILDL